jgi:Ecdysteroid kinase-like family
MASYPPVAGLRNERKTEMIELPSAVEGLTPELLTRVLHSRFKGTEVVSAEVRDAKTYGELGVSTSARVTLDLAYNKPPSTSLPSRVVVKMSLDNEAWRELLHPQFENEVDFYNGLRPELNVEVPHSLGGYFDDDSKRYLLILEDLRLRGAHFQSLKDETTVETVQSVLETHAKLHASLWQSPRFKGDLSWVQNQMSGNLETFMRSKLRDGFREEYAMHPIKREIITSLGADEEMLYTDMAAVKRHQSRLPQTMLHGDSHIENTYLLPDGTGGLYDWAASIRGYPMHDVMYHINTALSIENRRKHERELLAFYRDRLGHYGVADPPDLDTLWLEGRRATIWGLYCWMPCVVEAYGLEKLTIVLLRLATAFRDHETHRLIAQIA